MVLSALYLLFFYSPSSATLADVESHLEGAYDDQGSKLVTVKPIKIILDRYGQLMEKKEDRVDNFHKNISQRIQRIVNSVDQMMEENKDLLNDSGSRLHVFNTSTFIEDNDSDNDLSFRFRLKLPVLKERLQLSLERRDADQERRNQNAEIAGATNFQDSDDSVQAGVGFDSKSKSWIKSKLSAGVKFREQAYGFGKLRLSNVLRLTKKTELRSSVSAFWNGIDLATHTGYFDIESKISTDFSMKWVNEVQWTETDSTLRVRHGPSFFHTISDRRSIHSYGRVFLTNRPNYQIENFRIGLSYRQRIVKKWIYYEVSPFVDFPKAQEFGIRNGIILKLEATFGELFNT